VVTKLPAGGIITLSTACITPLLAPTSAIATFTPFTKTPFAFLDTYVFTLDSAVSSVLAAVGIVPLSYF
jgi:hypothetical protein